MSEGLPKDISRRKFIGLVTTGTLGLVGLGVMNALRTPQSSKMVAPLFSDELEGTQELSPPTEIIGQFPEKQFSFSETVTKYDLIPTVLDETLSFPELQNMAVMYLLRLKEALHDHPALDTTTLDDLRVVGHNNLPISFSTTDTAYTIVDEFINDFFSGTIVFLPNADAKAPYFFGTINSVSRTQDNGLVMKAEVHHTDELPYIEYPEEHNTFYRGYTDVQVALKMIHEYAHFRQGQALLTIGLNYGKFDRAHTPISAIEDSIDQLALEDLSRMNMNPDIDRHKYPGFIEFNEAQANQVSQLLLLKLQLLNDSKRMPGTEDDMYPRRKNSIYRSFLQSVYLDKNIFEPGWYSLYEAPSVPASQ